MALNQTAWRGFGKGDVLAIDLDLSELAMREFSCMPNSGEEWQSLHVRQKVVCSVFRNTDSSIDGRCVLLIRSRIHIPADESQPNLRTSSSLSSLEVPLKHPVSIWKYFSTQIVIIYGGVLSDDQVVVTVRTLNAGQSVGSISRFIVQSEVMHSVWWDMHHPYSRFKCTLCTDKLTHM